MHLDRRQLITLAEWTAPGVLAALVALVLSRPFAAGPVAFDSAMAVLHFQRIVEGRHLEAFVATTPKPLLTLLYGPLYALTHDWRALTWATIAAFAVGVSLAANLARRIDGRQAFAFAAVTLAGAPLLLYDASQALATPWALALWAIAGWAVSRARPRYGVAGIALGLASLARLETLVVVGVALVALAVVRFGPRQVRRPVPRSAWLIALGLLAVPVAMVHDWRLTGDPLFWATVAQRYSELTHNKVLTPSELVAMLGKRYLAESALVILAVLGWIRLAARGSWAIAIGLLGLGPGIAAFLVLLSARHTFVSDRYFAGIDVALAFSAAFGLAALTVTLPSAIRRSWTRGSSAAWGAPLIGAVLAVVLTAGWAGLGTTLGASIRSFTRMAVAAKLATPTLRAEVDAIPGARAWPAPGSSPSTGPLVLVPTPLRPQMTIDLGLPLTRTASISPAAIDVAAGLPARGQLLFQDLDAEVASTGLEQLQVGQPTTIGGVTVVPLIADPARGFWVVRIDPAQ